MPVYYTTIKPNYTFQFATPLGFAHCNKLIFMQFTRKSDLCVICTYGYTPYSLTDIATLNTLLCTICIVDVGMVHSY